MSTIAESIYADARVGIPVALPKAGTPLQNRYVFDSSAREIVAMAERGLVEIASESRASEDADAMITDIVFVKMG